MKKINLFWILIIFVQMSFAQTEKAFSEGILEINQLKSVNVKIYSNPGIFSIEKVLDAENDILIILNKFNIEANTQENVEYLNLFYNKFISKGYWLLDKNFKPLKNYTTARYILKTDKIKNFEHQDIKLKTSFTIWNPNEGFTIFGITIRYYGIMFVLAFGLGVVIMKYFFKLDNVDEKYIDPLFTWTLFGTIFGARIGHVIFYESYLFSDDFWSVFLPIRTKPSFEFTGFSGLASHGATIALILTTLYYSIKIIKKNPFWVYDRLSIVIALAGFFIRIGNFFNSEIIGKPISPKSPIAFYFPQQSLDYGAIVPRYPTQLIEAFGYLFLFFILFGIYRLTKKKYLYGWLFGLFFIVLWLIRFFVEFLKEPQGEEYISFLGLNTGQVLSIPFILIGFGVLMYSSRKQNN